MTAFLHNLFIVLLVGAASAQDPGTTAPPAQGTTAAAEPNGTRAEPATSAAPVETTAASTQTTAAAEQTTVAPDQTTVATKTQPPDMGGLTVTCTQEYMVVTLDLNKQKGLNLDQISLQDKNCKIADSNETHVTFKTALDKCGTKHNTTKEHIVYYNNILSETKTGNNSSPIISRDFQATFPFQCSFPRRSIVSVTSFSPRMKVVYTRASEYGNFTFLMDLFKTKDYKETVDRYPYLVNLGQKMFFKLEVKSKDSKLVLFVKNAMATPSTDPKDNAYVFIEDGCIKDDTLEYKYDKNSPTQMFNIDAFRFIEKNAENIYVHAELEVCRSDDDQSVCAKGCQKDKRRRRAVEEAPSAVLYVGPMQVSQAHSAGSAAGTSVGTVGIIATTLGALVFVLIVALVVVFRRRSAPPATKIVFTRVNGEERNRLV